MLTEEQIEKILYRYVKRQDEFNMSVITLITDRLSHIADFDKLSTLDRLSVMTVDIRKINEEYAKYKKDQDQRIEDDFWELVFFLYGEALIYYENQIALRQNQEIVLATQNLIAEAQESFNNLVNRPVFVLRDLQNPSRLRVYNLEQAYRTSVNEALMYSNLSDELRDIALKRTELQLFDSGVRYMRDNTSNDVDDAISANSAVRFNVLDNMRNLINRVQTIMGNQFGADGAELSAHIYPAPDHAPAQGHIFSNENIDKMQSAENFEDIDGNSYIGFERQIGTWNCRHYFTKVKISKAQPTYTQEELDKILDDNERGYTAPNGRHYTLYECTQIQRRYERNIRKAKEKYLLAKSINDKNMMHASRARVGSLTTQYKQFSRACDIPAKLERIRVKDY